MNQANYLYGKKVSTVRTYGPRIYIRDQTTIMQYTNMYKVLCLLYLCKYIVHVCMYSTIRTNDLHRGQTTIMQYTNMYNVLCLL